MIKMSYNYIGMDTGEIGSHKDTHVEKVYTVHDQFGELDGFKNKRDAESFIDRQRNMDLEEYGEKQDYWIDEELIDVSNKRIIVNDEKSQYQIMGD